MKRITPFEHAFQSLADQHFSEIGAEAERAAANTGALTQFASLATVQLILDEMEAPELLESDPAAAPQYVTLLHAAYRFWEAGKHLFAIERAAVPALIQDDTVPAPTGVPYDACYLQLPERLFWAQVAPEQPHEPIDGMFAMASPGSDEITIVAVLGLRDDRAGLSVVAAVATLDEMKRSRQEARTPPFAPAMEGGERVGFHSVVTTAELLLLAGLGLRIAQRERRTTDCG